MATPLALSVPWPMLVEPSWKMTMPPGMAVGLETEAVRVTGLPERGCAACCQYGCGCRRGDGLGEHVGGVGGVVRIARIGGDDVVEADREGGDGEGGDAGGVDRGRTKNRRTLTEGDHPGDCAVGRGARCDGNGGDEVDGRACSGGIRSEG